MVKTIPKNESLESKCVDNAYCASMSNTQTFSPQSIVHKEVEQNALRRGATIVGLLSIALIHVLDLPGKWAETRYLGIGYVLVIAASLILAEIISTRNDKRAMYGSAALAIAVLAGYIINRTVGMPNATEDIGNWGEPLGLASLFVEAITVWVTVRSAMEMHHHK